LMPLAGYLAQAGKEIRAMTGEERVRRAIEFSLPDRIPWTLPEPWGSDIAACAIAPHPDWTPPEPGMDEWGAVWMKLDEKTMGEVKRYPIDSWKDLETFQVPDYFHPERWRVPKLAFKVTEGRFHLGSIESLFHRASYLRGLDQLLVDMYESPDEVERLLDIIVELDLRMIETWKEIGAHGIFFCDDWGLQDRLFISPELFRRFFKPRYARIWQRCRELGLLTFLHTCGYTFPILGDFFEAGLQVAQLDQQENMGLENLDREFSGKLAFWCPVDIQQTMQKRAHAVREYARRMIWHLGRKNGGFIGGYYSAPQAVGHRQENIDAMCAAFAEFGFYPIDPLD